MRHCSDKTTPCAVHVVLWQWDDSLRQPDEPTPLLSWKVSNDIINPWGTNDRDGTPTPRRLHCVWRSKHPLWWRDGFGGPDMLSDRAELKMVLGHASRHIFLPSVPQRRWGKGTWDPTEDAPRITNVVKSQWLLSLTNVLSYNILLQWW